MKYMLLIYSAESVWTDEQVESCLDESYSICDELAAQGKLLDASRLHNVDTATCVRVRQQQRELHDGPFAETHEQLGGYYLIDVESLDEAIQIAEKLPPAKKGTVEIRPLYVVPNREINGSTKVNTNA